MQSSGKAKAIDPNRAPACLPRGHVVRHYRSLNAVLFGPAYGVCGGISAYVRSRGEDRFAPSSKREAIRIVASLPQRFSRHNEALQHLTFSNLGKFGLKTRKKRFKVMALARDEANKVIIKTLFTYAG
jgi:hypothetical protein